MNYLKKHIAFRITDRLKKQALNKKIKNWKRAIKKQEKDEESDIA